MNYDIVPYFKKWPPWFISFFTVDTAAFLSLVSFVVVAQDISSQIKGSWRFLTSTHLYINKITVRPQLSKFGMIYLLMFILPHSSLFKEKAKISSIQEDSPTLANKLSDISVVLIWLYLWNNDYSGLHQGAGKFIPGGPIIG